MSRARGSWEQSWWMRSGHGAAVVNQLQLHSKVNCYMWQCSLCKQQAACALWP